jgi:hypothetical protein
LDFEGYLVYRSTDAEFNDIKLITDSRGNPRYWKPIAQFDLRDSVSGPDPIGINGARFWRGNNTGLQHSFVDTTVLNGVRYYYAVVSYDQGDPNKGILGLQPTECTKIVTEDAAGTLKFIDINCAIITPSAASAGYVPAQIEGNVNKVAQGIGTGALKVQVLNPNEIQEGATYRVLFDASGTVPKYTTSSYSIARMNTSGTTDTLQTQVSTADFGTSVFSTPFDGLNFSFMNDTVVAVMDTATGWLVGTRLDPRSGDNPNAARDVAWPADYELRWYSGMVDTALFNLPPRFPRMPVNFKITNVTSNQQAKFIVDDADRSNTLSFGDTIRIIEGYISPTVYNLTWRLTWERGPGLNPAPPQDGDRFVIRTRRPFAKGDYFEFKTRTARTNFERAVSDMGNITVVPNPYISSSSWERRSLFTTGRGDRRLLFTHLPAQCTVRIYTVAGYLVKTLSKDSNASDGSLAWDLVTDDGMDLAYGLYVYHVDAPGIGEHIGKFAVIK